MAERKCSSSPSEDTPCAPDSKKPKLDSSDPEVKADNANEKVENDSKVIQSEKTSPANGEKLPASPEAEKKPPASSAKEDSSTEQSAEAASVPRYMSVDVECVATGERHDAREVCSVAVVDGSGKVLLSKKVKPTSPVASYLTPLTGLHKGDLDDGARLEDVIVEVKALMGPGVVLVGQGIANDIKWLQLQQGVDYNKTVDLGEMFKVFNPRYGSYNFSSLSHEANTLLRPGFISEQHDPTIDAIASIQLFNKYHDKPRELEQAKQKLLRNRPPMSFAKRSNYRYEGVCMAAYYPAKCSCGAPTNKSSN